MELEQTTSEVNEVIPAETQTETQPQVEAEGAKDPVDAQAAPVPQEPEYKPDYSYRVADQVKEFDQRLRSLIKTKEDEAWVRELVTKADGLEINKRNLETAAKERDYYKNEYLPLKKEVDTVIQMRDNGDIDSLLTVLGISEKQLLAHAYKKAQLMELTPEQRAEYDKYNKVQFSQYSLKQQNEELQKKLEQIELTQRKAELQNTLGSSDYADIAKEFDQRNGANAFYNEVVRRGAFYESTLGQSKSVGEVVSEIINLYGLKREAPKVKAHATKVDLPVIPNTGAGAVAPVAKKIKSVSELRSYAQTLED